MDPAPHKVDIGEAEVQFSRLVARVEGGEEIIIARAGKPVARLVPLTPERPKPRVFGREQGKLVVPDDFDAPDPEIEAMFYGDDAEDQSSSAPD